MRQERDALWEVQIEAEELHWQVAAGRPVSFRDVKQVWNHFVQVKKISALNHPDTWNASTSAATQSVASTKYLPPLAQATATPVSGAANSTKAATTGGVASDGDVIIAPASALL